MSLTKFTGAVNTISSLADKPAKTAQQLKGDFDKVGALLKEYINDHLTEELDSKISEFATKIQNNTSSLDNMLNRVYPVGSIYMSVDNTNPTTLFGGTWIAWGEGRVPVGINSNETEFNTVEKTGGEKTHTLTTAQIPSHGHSVSIENSGSCTTSNAGLHHHSIQPLPPGYGLGQNGPAFGPSSSTTSFNTSDDGDHTHTVPNHTHTVNQSNVGGGQAHNNLQPYITCYMWKRTA